MTLDLVRRAAGYTINEAAEYCDMPAEEMKRLEDNPGDMPASMVSRLRRIYKFPIDYVSLVV